MFQAASGNSFFPKRGKSRKHQVDTRQNGRTIRITGTVSESLAPNTPNTVLKLTSGNTIISILIADRVSPPPIGALVQATGACLVNDFVDMDTDTLRATAVSLALRSPEDLRILASPPWWTTTRLFLLAAVLTLLLFGILTWNAVLRRIVIRRSRALAKETLRSKSTALRLEERTRLAVELHDTIAQNLTGASFEIKTISRLANAAPERMKEHLEIVDHMLKSCRDDVRNCIWDLRANSLNQRDLNRAIDLALSPHIGSATLRMRFDVPRSSVSESTLYALIRIVRELAINAVRHGHATEIKVAGSIEENALLCSVRDNGCGFNPDRALGVMQGHYGLQGIRERLKNFDGSMTIYSSPGNGTRIVLRLNLLPSEEQS